ncbi:MAG: hypothetical protein IJN19_06770 [Opitutales bacterium]|nr:hypothetical protein [Opitutales bacterium]
MENFEERQSATPGGNTAPDNVSAGTPIPPPLRLKVVGVGGAATRMVSQLCAAKTFAAEFVAADTSVSELVAAERFGVRTVLLGENITGGIGAGTEASRGAAAAKASEETLRAMLAGTDLIVLIASLGRGTGSGASVEIVNLARETGVPSVCFATTPFSWEGVKSTEQASVAIDALHANSNAFILIENNLIAQTVASGGSFSEGFKVSDRWIESGVTACCRMLLNTSGRMRVDLASFKNLFPNVGTRTLFSVGGGEGGNAQEEALTELFRCPLLKTRTSVASDAETLAIHIETGTEPPLAFVNETVQRVKDRFGGDLRTLSSYAINPSLGNRLEICVFGAAGLRKASRVVHPVSKKKKPDTVMPGGVLVLGADDDDVSDGNAEPTLALDDRLGGFAETRHRLFEGKDLDTPTYIRKQINLDKTLAKKKKEFGGAPKK